MLLEKLPKDVSEDDIEVVSVLIEDKQGRFLIVRRPKSAESNAGFWEVPGGGREEGESLSEAGLREVWEEVGLKIRIVPGKAFFTLQGKDDSYGVMLRGKTTSNLVNLRLKEHDALIWMNPDQIKLLKPTYDDFYKLTTRVLKKTSKTAGTLMLNTTRRRMAHDFDALRDVTRTQAIFESLESPPKESVWNLAKDSATDWQNFSAKQAPMETRELLDVSCGYGLSNKDQSVYQSVRDALESVDALNKCQISMESKKTASIILDDFSDASSVISSLHGRGLSVLQVNPSHLVCGKSRKAKVAADKQTLIAKAQGPFFGSYGDDHCPECGDKCQSACRCMRNDRFCSNGHVWEREKETGLPLLLDGGHGEVIKRYSARVSTPVGDIEQLRDLTGCSVEVKEKKSSISAEWLRDSFEAVASWEDAPDGSFFAVGKDKKQGIFEWSCANSKELAIAKLRHSLLSVTTPKTASVKTLFRARISAPPILESQNQNQPGQNQATTPTKITLQQSNVQNPSDVLKNQIGPDAKVKPDIGKNQITIQTDHPQTVLPKVNEIIQKQNLPFKVATRVRSAAAVILKKCSGMRWFKGLSVPTFKGRVANCGNSCGCLDVHAESNHPHLPSIIDGTPIRIIIVQAIPMEEPKVKVSEEKDNESVTSGVNVRLIPQISSSRRTASRRSVSEKLTIRSGILKESPTFIREFQDN